MKYRELFEKVQDHIVSPCNWKCSLKTGRPPAPKSVAAFSRYTKMDLPTELSDLFSELGEGPEMYWHSPESEKDASFCNMRYPSMKDLIAEMRFRRTQMLPGVESYVRETLTGDDREASLKLVKQMHLWVPVLRIGNGDFICIDASTPDAPIRYDSHESLPSDNGLFMAANLNVFLTEWADKCFQEPKSLYWPSCIGKHGVNWKAKDFGYPRIK